MADIAPRRGSPTQFALFRIFAAMSFIATFARGGELPPETWVRVLGVLLSLGMLFGWKRRFFALGLFIPFITAAVMMDGPRWPVTAISLVIALLIAVIPEGEPFAIASVRRTEWGVPPAWMTLGEVVFFGGGWYAALSILRNGSVVPLVESGFLCPLMILGVLVIDARWLHPKFSAEPPVVYFDGVCGLCNSFIDWLFAEDANQIFKVSALQSEYAQKTIGDKAAQGEVPPGSIILKDEQGIHDKSTAVIRIATKLGGVMRLAPVLMVIPRPIRDGVYGYVAKNRYKWFGKKETCRLPTKEERAKFLT